MPAARVSVRDPGRAVRHADPDDDRRAAVGDRHRRHGPAGALQRAGDVGPRGGGGGRRRYAAARQDRHHHARQPPGDRVPAAAGVTEQELADAAQLASLSDETPEGRSIVVLAKEKYDIRGREMAHLAARASSRSRRRRGISGIDLDGSSIRKGAVDAVLAYVAAGDAPQWRPTSRCVRVESSNAMRPRRSPVGRHAAGRGARTAACSASSI